MSYCRNHTVSILPQQYRAGLEYYETQTEPNAIAEMAIRFKEASNRRYVQLPFCTTVESEAYGAVVNYGSWEIGPRISKYAFSNFDELVNSESFLQSSIIEHPRVKAMLMAAEILAKAGENVIFNLTGPLTALSGLVDIAELLKASRRDLNLFNILIQKVTKDLSKYVYKIGNTGVQWISYSDPIALLSVMGPKTFRSFSAPVQISLLEAIRSVENHPAIHACGELSRDLEQQGHIIFTNANKEDYHKPQTLYGHSCTQNW